MHHTRNALQKSTPQVYTPQEYQSTSLLSNCKSRQPPIFFHNGRFTRIVFRNVGTVQQRDLQP